MDLNSLVRYMELERVRKIKGWIRLKLAAKFLVNLRMGQLKLIAGDNQFTLHNRWLGLNAQNARILN